MSHLVPPSCGGSIVLLSIHLPGLTLGATIRHPLRGFMRVVQRGAHLTMAVTAEGRRASAVRCSRFARFRLCPLALQKAVRRFIEDGLAVQAMPEGQAKDGALEKLERKLDRLTRMRVTRGRSQPLVKRIEKYRADLIRFVTHPGVEFHNNRAERQFRPIVVNRKLSFGSSTEKGARPTCAIHTVVETCKLNGLRVAKWLADLLAARERTPPSPFAKPAEN